MQKIATDNARSKIIDLVTVYSNDDDYESWKGLPSPSAGYWDPFKHQTIPRGCTDSKFRIGKLKELAEKWANKGINTQT